MDYDICTNEHAFQRGQDLYTAYNRLKNKGYSQKEIAEKLGIFDRNGNPNVVKLRAQYSNAKAERRAAMSNEAMRLKEEGLNNSEIGSKMGINESSVRSLLDPAKAARNELNYKTADILKDYVDKNRYMVSQEGE